MFVILCSSTIHPTLVSYCTLNLCSIYMQILVYFVDKEYSKEYSTQTIH